MEPSTTKLKELERKSRRLIVLSNVEFVIAYAGAALALLSIAFIDDTPKWAVLIIASGTLLMILFRVSVFIEDKSRDLDRAIRELRK